MKTIDFTKLKGEDLFWYFTNDYPDEDYSSVVQRKHPKSAAL